MTSGSLLSVFTVFLTLMVTKYTLAMDIPKQRKITTEISGPTSLDDRIAIVGAGPSGIHMAYKLIGAGFKRVTVFESSDYIGGKARSIYYRRTPHDMGTYSSHADFTEYYKLVEEFDAGELRSLPDYNVWLNNGKNSKLRLSVVQYAVTVAKQLNPGLNDSEVIPNIERAIVKYIALHTELFGSYEGWLMPRPTKRVLSSLKTTFLDLLKEHDIEVLKSVFIITLTSQGLGHLDELSALYGLMWMTPSYIYQVFYPSPFGVNKIMSKGNQFLWQEIATQLRMDVRLSSPVKKIVRSKGPQRVFQVRYNTACGKTLEEDFDFLILSPSMKSLTDIVNFNRKETELFKMTTNIFLTASMVDTTYGKRRGLTPRSLHVDNIQSKVDNQVVVQHDSYGLLNNFVGENYTKGMFPGGPDGEKKLTQLYYQFATSYPKEQNLKSRLRRHITNVERAELLTIKEQIVWSHFPRYSVSDMSKGVLWDILDMQGKYGIWYTGSSVSFETLHSVLQYNNLLFQLYDVPSIS